MNSPAASRSVPVLGISLKLASIVVFAAMTVCIKFLGSAIPAGQTIFVRGLISVVVLALIAERISAVPFHDLVLQRVCEPAGMRDTAFLRSDELPGRTALGYLDINTREIIGDPRGEWGQESRIALRAFIKDHDLKPTEELDATTYRAILAAYDAQLEARSSAAAEERRRAPGPPEEKEMHH